MRTETRRQRYDKKINNAKTYPFSLCAINFRVDDNFGHLIRSAACFGAERVYVVGYVPERSEIKSSSGSLIDYVEIIQFSTPQEFWNTVKKSKLKLWLQNWWMKQDHFLLTASILMSILAWLLATNQLEFLLK